MITRTATIVLPSVLAILITAAPVRAVELFGPATGFQLSVGGIPLSVALADFNGDGRQDLAVASCGDGIVSVFLGDGRGTFARSSSFVLEDCPISIVVSDFNGDAAQDLAVARSGNGPSHLGSVVILTGDGLGGFVPATELAVGSHAGVLVAGDFNGDGAPDLAVANLASNSVSILIGEGDGSFSRTDVAVGRNPSGIAAGDLNTDGVEDLVVVNQLDDTVALLLGDGLGGFIRAQDVAVGYSPQFVAISDLNGDGTRDLTVSRPADESAAILLGDGRGRFVRTPDIFAGQHSFVAMGDLDADGATDFVFAGGYEAVNVLLGNGRGGVAVGNDVPAAGYRPTSVAVGDFNGDSRLDLAVGNGSSDTVSLLRGDGRGGFVAAAEVAVGRAPEFIVVGSFNADSAQDLAVANSGDGTVSILVGDGHGGLVRNVDVTVGQSPWSVATGDFNADGRQDLAVANQGDGTVSILAGDGCGGFVRGADIAVGQSPWSVAVGDFNADGAQDLAVANEGDGTVSILVGDHRGGFTHAADLTARHTPSFVVVADFNADGVPDLAVANRLYRVVSLFIGDGRGGFVSGRDVIGVGCDSLAVEDFNGDGSQDLALIDAHGNGLTIVIGDGHGGFAISASALLGGLPSSVTIGDFDSDGASDLAISNYSADSVSVLVNQLRDRADTNGSNRIDGFDVAAIARLAGAQRCPPDNLGCGSAYYRNEDVNLDGIIDGEDLALVAHRFGKLRRAVSPLHGAVATSAPPSAGTVTLQQVASEADLLTVQVLVSNTTDPAAAASFAVDFEPTDGAPGQVLEVAGFDPGTYLSGGAELVYDVDSKTPGMAKVTVTRLPNTDQTALSAQPLMTLYLRARRMGQAKLDFAPLAYSLPALLNAAGQPVSVTFAVGNVVTVDASGGGPPGQQLGFSPDLMNFSSVDLGSTSRKTLRISNFGYSDLEVSNLTSTLPEFSSFFTSAFTVPPYGYIEMPVLFTPARKGWFSGDLIIASNDAAHPETRVPVEGESDASLAVVPDRLTFGNVAAGSTKVLTLKLTNRGTMPLTLTGFQSSDGQFVPRSGFTTLDPGQTGQLTVQFTPAASATIQGTLTLSFDAPDVTTVVVGMVGAGF